MVNLPPFRPFFPEFFEVLTVSVYSHLKKTAYFWLVLSKVSKNAQENDLKEQQRTTRIQFPDDRIILQL